MSQRLLHLQKCYGQYFFRYVRHGHLGCPTLPPNKRPKPTFSDNLSATEDALTTLTPSTFFLREDVHLSSHRNRHLMKQTSIHVTSHITDLKDQEIRMYDTLIICDVMVTHP